MQKIFAWILAVGLIFSFSQAFAKEPAIYAGDNASLAREFNAQAKKFGNFHVQDFKFIMTLDDCDLYDAIIEGAGKEISEATLRHNEDKQIARFIITVDNKAVAEKIWHAALATLKIPDTPFKEMDDAPMKNAAGTKMKVSTYFYNDGKSETYTLTFRT